MSSNRIYVGALKGLLAAGLLLLVTLNGALAAPAGAGSKNLGHVLKKTLLLFPFDVDSAAAPNSVELSNLLTDAAASRLIASNNYSVTTFYRAWPPVARLHNDQQVSEADVIAPFAEDNRKSTKIAKLVGYETVCLGSVDDYTYNQSDHQVNLTVSARIILVETGQVLKNVTLSANSVRGSAKSTEEELNLDAARQAMEKIMVQLAPLGTVPVTIEPTKSPAKRKGSGDWVWGLLAIVGLGIGLSSGGGGGGGGGIDNPPPPPR